MWLKCYLHSLQSSPLYPVEHSLKQLPLMWWQWLAFKQGPHLFKHSGPKKPISHPCKEKERIKHIVKHVSSIYKKIGIFVFNNLINVNESSFVFSFACNVNANKSLSRQVIYPKKHHYSVHKWLSSILVCIHGHTAQLLGHILRSRNSFRCIVANNFYHNILRGILKIVSIDLVSKQTCISLLDY